MNRSVGWTLLGLGVLAVALGSAESQADDKKADKGTVVEIDGLKSTTPASWVEEKPANRFRVKQFKLPKVGEDKEDAVMLVMHLEGAGGNAEENVKRWKGMFTAPQGKSIDDVAKVTTFKVGNVPATYVDVAGTYTAPPFEKLPPKKDYRMLAVFWDSKTGPYFFRIVGPAKTVESYQKGFDEWVKGFK